MSREEDTPRRVSRDRPRPGRVEAVIFDWGGTLTPWHEIDLGEQWRVFAREIHGIPFDHADVAETDLARAHTAALAHLRGGGESLTLNCGYGTGFSVLEVIQVVKEVSGVDFEVRHVARRPGDPAALVAGAEQIRARLGWKPAYDSLRTIVEQALAWERRLAERQAA